MFWNKITWDQLDHMKSSYTYAVVNGRRLCPAASGESLGGFSNPFSGSNLRDLGDLSSGSNYAKMRSLSDNQYWVPSGKES